MNNELRKCLLAGEKAGSRFVLSGPRRAPLGVGGLHLSDRTGASLEFKDHREYQPGDDLRRIDWNAYARSDRLIVKLYREEVSPHLDVIIDASRSMALENTPKLEAIVGLAAIFAVAAANAGFSHCAWMAAGLCVQVPGSADRPSAWDNLNFDYAGDISLTFSRSALPFRRQGMRVLISDLLWVGDPLLTLHNLSRDASTVVVIQLLAAADLDPPHRGNLRLLDSETEEVREIFIDEAAVLQYKETLNRHTQNWRQACTQVGGLMATLVAEENVESWKLDELVSLEILRAV